MRTETNLTKEPPTRSRPAPGIDVSRVTPKPSWNLRLVLRLRQFVRGLTANVRAEEMLVAAQLLSKPALTHFCQMPADAQRHSLNVLYMLQKADQTDPELAAAALLHDVGKIAADQAGLHLSPWLRGPLVLLDKVAPRQVERWAADDPTQGWRYLLHVHRSHPQIGADWAGADGCSELTCWLIEHHQDTLTHPPQARKEKLLLLLQWADNRN